MCFKEDAIKKLQDQVAVLQQNIEHINKALEIAMENGGQFRIEVKSKFEEIEGNLAEEHRQLVNHITENDVRFAGLLEQTRTDNDDLGRKVDESGSDFASQVNSFIDHTNANGQRMNDALNEFDAKIAKLQKRVKRLLKQHEFLDVK